MRPATSDLLELAAVEPGVTRPIIVHHLDHSRSQRILWLLEELEVPYIIKYYWRSDKDLPPPDLKHYHPLGTWPMITDGNITLPETGAIVDYIIHKYDTKGKFKVSEENYATNAFFHHFAEGGQMPWSMFAYYMSLLLVHAPLYMRPFIAIYAYFISKFITQPRVCRGLQMFEQQLESLPEGYYLAGEDHPTSGDIMISFCLEFALSRHPDDVGPKSREYLRRVHKRPAYQRALEKGGQYRFKCDEILEKA